MDLAGGVDLSIPIVMNFCASLAVQMVDQSALSIVVTLAVAIGFGVGIGLVNGIVILAFRVPSIIGTLAVGYVVLTLVQLLSSRGGATTFAARDFTNFIRADIAGIPVPFFFVLAVGGLAALLIKRTTFGRSLLAVGQSRGAAYLAGIGIGGTILGACLISGGLPGYVVAPVNKLVEVPSGLSPYIASFAESLRTHRRFLPELQPIVQSPS